MFPAKKWDQNLSLGSNKNIIFKDTIQPTKTVPSVQIRVGILHILFGTCSLFLQLMIISTQQMFGLGTEHRGLMFLKVNEYLNKPFVSVKCTRRIKDSVICQLKGMKRLGICQTGRQRVSKPPPESRARRPGRKEKSSRTPAGESSMQATDWARPRI